MLYGNDRDLLRCLVDAELQAANHDTRFALVNDAAKAFFRKGDRKSNEESFFALKDDGYIDFMRVSHEGPTGVEIKNKGRYYFEKEDKNTKRSPSASVAFHGDFNIYGGAPIIGGNISTGNIIVETTSWIRAMIEEKGGEEKPALYALLDEAADISREIKETAAIPNKKGFLDRLNSHVVKHGWFYGAVLQLIGTAAIALM